MNKNQATDINRHESSYHHLLKSCFHAHWKLIFQTIKGETLQIRPPKEMVTSNAPRAAH